MVYKYNILNKYKWLEYQPFKYNGLKSEKNNQRRKNG